MSHFEPILAALKWIGLQLGWGIIYLVVAVVSVPIMLFALLVWAGAWIYVILWVLIAQPKSVHQYCDCEHKH